MQTKGETASVKEQFKQRVGSLKSYADNMHKKQSKQKATYPRANKRLEADTHSQHNANNTTKPSVITNPMVTGNKNNKNSLLSESTNKDTLFPFIADN